MISLPAIGLGMLQAALERAAQARVPPPSRARKAGHKGPGEGRVRKRKAYGASREGAEEKQ